MKKKITPEMWEIAATLLSEGKTQKEVALELGCTQALVSWKLGKRREKKQEAAQPGSSV